MNNQMEICDIFHFQTGETIFVGNLPKEIPLIRSKSMYIANLIVDGKIHKQNIQITGEMTGGKHPDGYRAIATMENLEINSEFIKNHNCQLVLVELR
jgi:hypothetical protein